VFQIYIELLMHGRDIDGRVEREREYNGCAENR
jgi:hypothetical protein